MSLQRQNCEKIFSRIRTNFFGRNPQIFTPQVTSNSQKWLEQQQKIWLLENFNKFSDISFPRTFAEPKTHIQELETVSPQQVHNPEPEDSYDNVEYVTHNSGEHAKFTKEQRLDLVRDLLLDEDSQNVPIMESMYYIYK